MYEIFNKSKFLPRRKELRKSLTPQELKLWFSSIHSQRFCLFHYSKILILLFPKFPYSHFFLCRILVHLNAVSRLSQPLNFFLCNKNQQYTVLCRVVV